MALFFETKLIVYIGRSQKILKLNWTPKLAPKSPKTQKRPQIKNEKIELYSQNQS